MPGTMSADEKKVLIGICKYIMSSDGMITEEEIDQLNRIAKDAGIDDYNELFDQVDREITSEEALQQKIDSLKNSPNLKKIIRYSIQMSRIDSLITYDEIDILVYAADSWGIDLKAVMKNA